MKRGFLMSRWTTWTNNVLRSISKRGRSLTLPILLKRQFALCEKIPTYHNTSLNMPRQMSLGDMERLFVLYFSQVLNRALFLAKFSGPRFYIDVALELSILWHYNDVIMGAMASRITGVSIFYSTLCLDVDPRKHQSSASVAFVRGIHLWQVIPLTKRPFKRIIFPFDDAILHELMNHLVIETWLLKIIPLWPVPMHMIRYIYVIVGTRGNLTHCSCYCKWIYWCEMSNLFSRVAEALERWYFAVRDRNDMSS